MNKNNIPVNYAKKELDYILVSFFNSLVIYGRYVYILKIVIRNLKEKLEIAAQSTGPLIVYGPCRNDFTEVQF